MLTRSAVESIGFAKVGKDVQISELARFYGAERIIIGDHVRIDDFCVLSAGAGGIRIGNYVHIAVFSSLIGQGKIVLSDFASLSSHVSIYSSNDDYSGASMTNPTVPDEHKNVKHAPARIGRHVIVGSGSVILPGITLADGVAIGVLSLVTKDCGEFGIYAGCPAKRIQDRSRALLDLEARFIANHNQRPSKP